MPIIYYAYYSPVSSSIPSISAQEHTLGRNLLTQGLEELYNIQLTSGELDSALQIAPDGKPYLPKHPDICFNISHCDGLAVCAFHNKPIGVDAELPGYFAEVLINKALSETEKDFLQRTGSTLSLKQEWFYRLWTLKEAYVKKSGTGVDTNLKDFSFSFTKHNEYMNVICSDDLVSCYQVKLTHGHIISLCYENNGEKITLKECQLT